MQFSLQSLHNKEGLGRSSESLLSMDSQKGRFKFNGAVPWIFIQPTHTKKVNAPKPVKKTIRPITKANTNMKKEIQQEMPNHNKFTNSMTNSITNSMTNSIQNDSKINKRGLSFAGDFSEDELLVIEKAMNPCTLEQSISKNGNLNHRFGSNQSTIKYSIPSSRSNFSINSFDSFTSFTPIGEELSNDTNNRSLADSEKVNQKKPNKFRKIRKLNEYGYDDYSSDEIDEADEFEKAWEIENEKQKKLMNDPKFYQEMVTSMLKTKTENETNNPVLKIKQFNPNGNEGHKKVAQIAAKNSSLNYEMNSYKAAKLNHQKEVTKVKEQLKYCQGLPRIIESLESNQVKIPKFLKPAIYG
ncbi:hypothetical protein TRFO_06483 [Tritrichomonas foetus]|uniref:Uncharacterized protein n=1 Tax=Tritrichomonas foetus TaxID=1144522 RepID=A0A1J4JZP4_9EUKA|nr:hypothetical protein TRFO_06483 [Tritrichomonas foetus]|eukprot:OHT04154.1 hypothetical protein TRFO_06483 [Tritrichomonas foetus]